MRVWADNFGASLGAGAGAGAAESGDATPACGLGAEVALFACALLLRRRRRA